MHAWYKAASSTAPQDSLTESLSARNSSSRVTMRNLTEGKEIREYIIRSQSFPTDPFSSVYPAPVFILDTLVVTSDTNISTCEVPWTWLSLPTGSCNSTVTTSRTSQTLKTPLSERHGLKAFHKGCSCISGNHSAESLGPTVAPICISPVCPGS